MVQINSTVWFYTDDIRAGKIRKIISITTEEGTKYTLTVFDGAKNFILPLHKIFLTRELLIEDLKIETC